MVGCEYALIEINMVQRTIFFHWEVKKLEIFLKFLKILKWIFNLFLYSLYNVRLNSLILILFVEIVKNKILLF